MKIEKTVKKALDTYPVDYMPDNKDGILASLMILLSTYGYNDWKKKATFEYEEISIEEITQLIQKYPKILDYCIDIPSNIVTYHKMWWA
jgi:hypothetical protein